MGKETRRDFLTKCGTGIVGSLTTLSLPCIASPVRNLLGTKETLVGGHTEPLPYDSEVEYIQQSNNGQYINTNIVPPVGSILKSEFRFTRTGWQANMCGQNYDIFGFTVSADGNFKAAAFDYWTIQAADTEWHTWLIDETKKYAKIDDGKAVTIRAHSTSSRPYCIFCRKRTDNNIDGRCTMACCHSLSLRTSSEKLLDMIAVRFTNEQGISEGAMYDKVSKSLFRNAGTGSFLIGSDRG